MSVLKLVGEATPNENLIKMAEELLADAKSGEILTVSYAAVLKDGSIRSAIGSPSDHVFSMFGAIERLKLRFYTLFVEEPEP